MILLRNYLFSPAQSQCSPAHHQHNFNIFTK